MTSVSRIEKRKTFCQYCGATVTGESDLFECPGCGQLYCKDHIVVVKSEIGDILCTFCAGDQT
ncbi:hypothetical protein HYR65_00440 [Candidatus Azambacteria bacterium]|nr:hypothetical protein [Candidatus Azambacteria bacterium]